MEGHITFSRDDTDTILLGRRHRVDDDNMDIKVYVDHCGITDAGTLKK